MMAAIDSAILSDTGTAIIDAIKWYVFFPVYALSAIGVVVGLRWESEKFIPPKQKLGKKVLLWSLAIETAFGVATIVSDGLISQAQKSEIIALEKKFVPRVISGIQKQEIKKQFDASGSPPMGGCNSPRYIL